MALPQQKHRVRTARRTYIYYAGMTTLALVLRPTSPPKKSLKRSYSRLPLNLSHTDMMLGQGVDTS